MAGKQPGKDDYVLPITDNPDEAVYWQSKVEDILQPWSRQMLEEYTGVQSDELYNNIQEAQKRAFKVAPYSSVGAMTVGVASCVNVVGIES